MLHLITGANGSGKTLFTLRWVRDRQLKENRQVYYNGRFRLKPEIEKEFGWLKFDFKDWQSFEDGAIFLVDESHNDLPVRPAGQPPPDHIRMLGEHRVRGFDFYLITQHPGNIDAFVRRLVGAPGWHRHLKRLMGAMPAVNVLHWDSVEPQPEKMSAKNSADVQKMQFPREVYNWYESATLHTAKFRVPRKLLLFIGCLILGVSLIYYALRTIGRSESEPQKTDLVGDGLKIPSQYPQDQHFNVNDLQAYIPRVPNLPHTAPRYDEITKPVEAPYPAICMVMRENDGQMRCQCYSQQATKMQVSIDFCINTANNGYFRDWKNPSDEKENQVSEVAKFEETQPPVSQTKVIDVGGRWDIQRWKSVKSTLD